MRAAALWSAAVLLAAGMALTGAAAARGGGGPPAAPAAHGLLAGPDRPTPRPDRTDQARSAEPRVQAVPTFAARPGVRQPRRAGAPVRLVVPDLDADVRPRPVGRLADGRLAIPDDGRVVVWWAYGAGPGERYGSVVLAGHVSWGGQWGVFARLASLRQGARLRLDRADGRRVHYRVTSVAQVPKARLDRLGVFATGGPPGLVLITCGGRWDAARHSYDDNVVVRATPVR